MSTIGSLTLCRSLLEAGLVDLFRVGVFPVIIGKTGREDAQPMDARGRLALVADQAAASISRRETQCGGEASNSDRSC